MGVITCFGGDSDPEALNRSCDNTFSFSWRGQVEFITCFGGDSDPEALNGSPKKKKNKKKKKTKKAYRDPIGKECRNC